MTLPIESLKLSSSSLWREAAGMERFSAHEIYTASDHSRKEREVDLLMNGVDESLEPIRRQPRKRFLRELYKRGDVRNRIQRAVLQLLHTYDCVVDNEQEDRFAEVTDEFIRQAYEFDPRISDEAVYQAARNVLIMNTFQLYFGKEVKLTPSVFAYSMLYPYTDNYLDSPDITLAEKRSVNDRLNRRLHGEKTQHRSANERSIDRLVGMIETEYDRERSPHVYESIYAIHRAQCRSVLQWGDVVSGSEELFDISVEKGGTSVLADGYLAAGDMTADDALFMFQFGVLLQLIDDLQDVEDDMKSGQRTWVGAIANDASLDDFTSHLWAFLLAVVDRTKASVDSNVRGTIRSLIDRGCRLLIVEAVALQYLRYNVGFLTRMERMSPVSFAYLRSTHQRIAKGLVII